MTAPVVAIIDEENTNTNDLKSSTETSILTLTSQTPTPTTTDKSENDKKELEHQQNKMNRKKRPTVLGSVGLFSLRFLHLLTPLRGVAFGVSSGMFLSFSKSLVKKVHTLNGAEHTLVRFLIQLSTALTLIKTHDPDMSIFGPERKEHPEVSRLLLLRGFIGSCNMIFVNCAVTLIAPSDVSALANSSVLITSILGLFFLNETLNRSHKFSLLLILGGVVFICQPTFLGFPHKPNDTFSHEGWKLYAGLLLAMTSACTISTTTILIKKLCTKKIYFGVTMIYGAYFGVPISFFLSFVLRLTANRSTSPKTYTALDNIIDVIDYTSVNSFNNSNNNGTLGNTTIVNQGTSWIFESLLGSISVVSRMDLLYSVLAGACGVLANISLNVGLYYELASRLALFKTSDLIFVFIFQYFFNDITQNWLNILGVCLIFSGTLLVLLHRLYLLSQQGKQGKEKEQEKQ